MKKQNKVKRVLLYGLGALALLLLVGGAMLYWPVSENHWKKASVLVENSYVYSLQGTSGKQLYFSSCNATEGMIDLSFEQEDARQKKRDVGYFSSPKGAIITRREVLAPLYDSLYFRQHAASLLKLTIASLTKKQQVLAHEIKELTYYVKTHFQEDDGFSEMQSLLAERGRLQRGQDSLLTVLKRVLAQPSYAEWGYQSTVSAYYRPEGSRRVYRCGKVRWNDSLATCRLTEKALPLHAWFILNPTFKVGDMQLATDSLGADSLQQPDPIYCAALLRTSDGVQYVGELKGNSPEGQGTALYADGSVYQGYWSGGHRHGWGIYSDTLQTRYSGEWNDNFFTAGEALYANGDCYRGTFLNDTIRDGAGEMLYADGSIYQGTWEDGIRQGFGMYVGATGVAQCGMWKAGKFQGERLLYTADRVYGIDISRYQHIGRRKRPCNIAWKYLRITNLGHLSKKRVKEPSVSYPVSFVYIKSTEGATVANAYYRADRKQAKKCGILTGAYHFFTSAPVGDQLKWFFKKTIYQPGDMPPMLDLEPTDAYIKSRWGSDEVMFDKVLHWLRAVEARYGVKPLLYVNQMFITRHLVHAPAELQSYDLWVARYGEFKPYTHMVYWQLSPDGKVSGIQSGVDINVFNGSKERFAEYVRSFGGEPAYQAD